MHADKFHRLNSSDIAVAWNIIDKQQISLNKKKIDNAIDFFSGSVISLVRAAVVPCPYPAASHQRLAQALRSPADWE